MTSFLTLADTDSYVKWGAALLYSAPADWDRQLVVLATPMLPSAAQLDAALAGIGPDGHPPIFDLSAFIVRLKETRPDVILLSLIGPTIKVVIRAIRGIEGYRPVVISGLPGISIPASTKAIAHRAQVDLIVLHSHREVREFSALAKEIGYRQRFALATLPFLIEGSHHRQAGRGDIVFAAQAKVPEHRIDRITLLRWLAETAKHFPTSRVVIKVRAVAGEAQTHAEFYDYPSLLKELPAVPPNLIVAGGPMAEWLQEAAALVTVSSTAAIEAVALGVPALIIDDFGVTPELINTVFEESGLLGSSKDLVAGRFKQPTPEWKRDNYFHGAAEDDWVAQVEALIALRDAGELPLKALQQGRFGGRLRRAWDRKRALGRFDRSWSGQLAIMAGTLPYLALRAYRRIRRVIAQPVIEPEDVHPR